MSNDKTQTPVNQPAERAKPERQGQPIQSGSAGSAALSPQRLAPGRPPLFGQ
jgi:hypothetical protein